MTFETFLAQIEPQLKVLARSMSKCSGVDPLDVAQECRLRAWQVFNQHNGEVPYPYWPYVRPACRYAAIDYLRQRAGTFLGNRRHGQDAAVKMEQFDLAHHSEPFDYDDFLIGDTEQDFVDTLLILDPGLSERQREMLVDYFVRELTLQQISEKHGRSVSAIHQRLQGIMEGLRRKQTQAEEMEPMAVA